MIILTEKKSSDSKNIRPRRVITTNGLFIKAEIMAVKTHCEREIKRVTEEIKRNNNDNLEAFLAQCGICKGLFLTIIRRDAAREWVERYADDFRTMHSIGLHRN